MQDTHPSLAQTLEAILFWRGETVTLSELAKGTQTTSKEIEEALNELEQALQGRGIALVRQGDGVALATAPDVYEIIAALRKEELEGPLGKAGLETLAVVIYHGPITRADIEYIRGVNSSSILRTLTMRGLIEKAENPENKRSVLYQPTTELPAALGVQKLSELPNFDAVRLAISGVLEESVEKESNEKYDQ
ncbi:MAG: SMC-Scp complex subunit ScpB [Patescibacteria group bacterium UBA2163]